MKRNLLLLSLLGVFISAFGQNPQITVPGTKILSDSIPKNGTLDRMEDLIFRAQVPFEMPDGVKLQTDIYLPIFQDDMSFDFELLGGKFNIKLIEKGTQYIIYDSINGEVNPNPYQLPIIFTRSPYNKKKAGEASIMTLMGFSGVVQDLRGRFESEGVFFPLYSDSWNKTPYLKPEDKHLLDINPIGHPQNPENFSDGANSIEFIKNNLYRTFDLSGDGVADTEDLLYTGSIGMFGASALGYSQTQAAAAKKIDPTQPGLKALLPIVATGEFQKGTLFPNGAFRENLVTGWLGGQIRDLDDEKQSIDNDIQNNIHTSLDFGLSSIPEVTDAAIDQNSTRIFSDGQTFQYPNSIHRKAVDISQAMVNEHGEGDPNGKYSRYSNMEVPTYYLSGWWDIFVDGTIETFMLQKQHVSEEHGNKEKIKLIIGPWAHETISGVKTGDAVYPENVRDVLGADITDFGSEIDLGVLVNSELFSWYRYNLNNVEGKEIGMPKFFLPEGKFQRIMQGVYAKVPAKDYKIPFNQLINFMLGLDGLKDMPVHVRLGSINVKTNVDLPKLADPLIPETGGGEILQVETKDFSKVPPVRFYVVGPMEDGVVENREAGNYWYGADNFPITKDITNKSLFLHGDGVASFSIPTEAASLTYIHNPDTPVIHLGGANMLGKTPEINDGNFGQIDYANPIYKPYVLDNPDILTFTTEEFTDTMSIIGFPKAKIYGVANPENAQAGDPTDIDFFVRILDVYPDGREMFVVDGGVNARAREYARSIAEDAEDIHAPFSNIESGKLYEYYFNLLPIGYTFGKGHKMKVIISSSNYNRHQSNPAIPLNDGEFFRRKPNEDKTYIFDGKEMTARKSVQQVYFSTEYPSQLILPIHGSVTATPVKNHINKSDLRINVFPNPAKDVVQVYMTEPGHYNYELYNIAGQMVKQVKSVEQTKIDLKSISAGAYILKVVKENEPLKSASIKIIKE